MYNILLCVSFFNNLLQLYLDIQRVIIEINSNDFLNMNVLSKMQFTKYELKDMQSNQIQSGSSNNHNLFCKSSHYAANS